MEGSSAAAPLSGVRLLAVENFVSGPYGSMMLADFGADVIKVESPEGDGYRAASPNYHTDAGDMSFAFLRVNRNKRSVVLDLKSPDGRAAFLDLVETSDVVWENLRSGAMDRLGLGWRELRARNPRLVYASISGFGHGDVLPPGPYTDLPAFDIVAQAMSGAMLTIGKEGDPPMYLGSPIADQLAGMLSAFGVVLALRSVELTGEGQHVDTAMYDVMVALNEQLIGHVSHFGELPRRGLSPTSAPYGAFRARDGWVAIGIASDAIWRRFCIAIGRPELVDDAELATGLARSARQEATLRPIIETWAVNRTALEVTMHLSAAGVPAGPVQDVSQLFDDPQVAAREMLMDVEDPVVGRLTVAGNPIKISGPWRVPRRPAPQLGADQALVAELRARVRRR